MKLGSGEIEKGFVFKLKYCWYNFKNPYLFEINAMNDNHTDAKARKVKYMISIVYLLVLAFVVGGSYIHQQHQDEDGVVVTDSN